MCKFLRLVVAAQVFSSAVTACSSFGTAPGGDRDASGAALPADSGRADGAVPRDAEPQVPIDAGVPMPVDSGIASAPCGLENLLENGDFERGAGGWNASPAAESVASPSVHGVAARFCSSATYFDINQSLRGPAQSADASVDVFGRIWVYSASADALRNLGVGLSIGKDYAYASLQGGVPKTGRWTCYSGHYVGVGPINTFFVSMNNYPPDGGTSCVVVDDALLVRVPDGGTIPKECICPPVP
jgi:hypothetical protein